MSDAGAGKVDAGKKDDAKKPSEGKRVLREGGKLILAFLILAAGVGFLAPASDSARHEYLVDAAPAKVWDLIADRGRAPEYLQGITELRLEPAGEGAGEKEEAKVDEAAAKKGEEKAPAAGAKGPLKGSRYVYVYRDSGTMTVEIVEIDPARRRYIEKVLPGGGRDRFFSEITWGYELEEAPGGKTKLVIVNHSVARKPIGNLMAKFAHWSGQMRRRNDAIAQAIQVVMKGGRPF